MKINKFLFYTLLTFALTLGLTTLNNISFALTDGADLTVDVIVPNTMEVTLDSSTLTFNNYTGASEKTSTVKVTVDSGLAYNLNGKFITDIETSDLVDKIPFSDVMICGDTVPQAVSDKNVSIPLSVNHINGLGINHWITVQLEPASNVKSAYYRGILQIEASQI